MYLAILVLIVALIYVVGWPWGLIYVFGSLYMCREGFRVHIYWSIVDWHLLKQGVTSIWSSRWAYHTRNQSTPLKLNVFTHLVIHIFVHPSLASIPLPTHHHIAQSRAHASLIHYQFSHAHLHLASTAGRTIQFIYAVFIEHDYRITSRASSRLGTTPTAITTRSTTQTFIIHIIMGAIHYHYLPDPIRPRTSPGSIYPVV